MSEIKLISGDMFEHKIYGFCKFIKKCVIKDIEYIEFVVLRGQHMNDILLQHIETFLAYFVPNDNGRANSSVYVYYN